MVNKIGSYDRNLNETRRIVRKSSPFTQIPFVSGWSQDRRIGDAPTRRGTPEAATSRRSSDATSETSFFPVNQRPGLMLRSVTARNPAVSTRRSMCPPRKRTERCLSWQPRRRRSVLRAKRTERGFQKSVLFHSSRNTDELMGRRLDVGAVCPLRVGITQTTAPSLDSTRQRSRSQVLTPGCIVLR